ncbi:MAG: YdcH family protein [Paracoccaceae bacterium]
MNARLTTRRTSLDARATALSARKHRLDAEIEAEMQRPVPCHLQLGKLKRSKLRLKDEIAEIEGVLTTVQRARLERRAN